jgi:hypothetical protein
MACVGSTNVYTIRSHRMRANICWRLVRPVLSLTTVLSLIADRPAGLVENRCHNLKVCVCLSTTDETRLNAACVADSGASPLAFLKTHWLPHELQDSLVGIRSCPMMLVQAEL